MRARSNLCAINVWSLTVRRQPGGAYSAKTLPTSPRFARLRDRRNDPVSVDPCSVTGTEPVAIGQEARVRLMELARSEMREPDACPVFIGDSSKTACLREQDDASLIPGR
jgi:hypothetical protein